MNIDYIILSLVGIGASGLLIKTMIKSFKSGKCSSCSEVKSCKNNNCNSIKY